MKTIIHAALFLITLAAIAWYTLPRAEYAKEADSNRVINVYEEYNGVDQ